MSEFKYVGIKKDDKNQKVRECLSCEKFFDCKYKKAEMEGCINYVKDKKWRDE